MPRYDVNVRTTIDLPDVLHRLAKNIAHDLDCSLSEAVVWLMRRGAGDGRPAGIVGTDPLTGFPIVHLGRVVTSDDVKALEDEELEYYDQFFAPRDASA